MVRAPRILIIDDDNEIWQPRLLDLLRSNGYHVESAFSTNQALEQLNLASYHLLIIDIRLPNDTEGMALLNDLHMLGIDDAVAIVMLSSYGTPQQMREAFAYHKVANFLAKDEFDDEDFLIELQRIFKERVSSNLELLIDWPDDTEKALELTRNLLINDRRIKRNSPEHHIIAEELEDLFCRLFSEAQSVLIRNLVRGFSGAGVVKIQPFTARGAARQVVVKYGDFRKIDNEISNYKSYILPYTAGGRFTAVLNLRRTMRLGGVIYSFLGDTSNDSYVDFGEAYSSSNITRIKRIIDLLFLDTCSEWYASLSSLQQHDLADDYQKVLGFTQDNLEHALADQLRSVQGKQRLRFSSLGSERTFVNPITAVVGRSMKESTYVCIQHGDFNQHNIFIDSSDHSWLIDFLRTGPGHALRDITELDTVVRIQLLKDSEATLAERLQMEEALASISRFQEINQLADQFSTSNPILARAFATSLHLRSVAAQLVGRNRKGDMREYHIASLYHALNNIRYYGIPQVQREHALLCASILAERLGF